MPKLSELLFSSFVHSQINDFAIPYFKTWWLLFLAGVKSEYSWVWKHSNFEQKVETEIRVTFKISADQCNFHRIWHLYQMCLGKTNAMFVLKKLFWSKLWFWKSLANSLLKSEQWMSSQRPSQSNQPNLPAALLFHIWVSPPIDESFVFLE